MIYAVYEESTGTILKTLDMPEFLLSREVLETGQAIVEIPRQANDATEIIENGKLVAKSD